MADGSTSNRSLRRETSRSILLFDCDVISPWFACWGLELPAIGFELITVRIFEFTRGKDAGGTSEVFFELV